MALSFTVGDLVEVRLNYKATAGEGVAMNVLHYQVVNISGGVPGMNQALSDIGKAMYEKFAPLWSPAASENVGMVSASAQNVFPLPRSVMATYVPALVTVGAVADDAMPLQDAPTLLKTTDVGQRWGIGRLFYAGLSESGQDQGQVDLITGALLQTMALALKDNVTAAGTGYNLSLDPVLVRGTTDNPVSLTKITGGRLSDFVIKTQRRRRPGKGS